MKFAASMTAAINDERRRRLSSPPQWTATHRFGLLPAPSGLAVVQDFLNTGGGGCSPDLLCDSELARDWAESVRRSWSKEMGTAMPSLRLTNTELATARLVRDRLHDALAVGWFDPTHPVSGTARFSLGPDGITWHPTATGWRGLQAVVLGEIFLAHRDGSWKRLKVCAQQSCRVTFYDRTWANGERFHNDRSCQRAAVASATSVKSRDVVYDVVV